MPQSHPKRRDVLGYALAAAGSSLLPIPQAIAQTNAQAANGAAQQPVRGGTLIVAQYPEPSLLTSAISPGGPANNISPKIFDGLLTYDFDLQPQPQLATSWSVSDDGLLITFHLREGVKWHDGKPFSSRDVVFSLQEAWRKHNGRAKAIFAPVAAIEAPDDLTVRLQLSAPAPSILYGLASHLAQILPAHIYEGTDALTNPANTQPIGTGPFRFVRWERGNYLELERNPVYWDAPRPYLDRVVYRFLPDASARSNALEMQEAHLVAETGVPGGDIARLAQLPYLEVTTKGYEYVGQTTFFVFNLDRKEFQDVRVRQAFAHAIDKDFLIKHIWHGYGRPASGPLPKSMGSFFSDAVPRYDFDIAKANALLDAAGYPKGKDGVRFRITHDPLPYGDVYARTGEYLREALAQVGIAVDLRSQDYAAYVRRIYTTREFDTANYLIAVGPDPAIGVQRLYWSQSFQPGIAFSNSAHYLSEASDALLEKAQITLDAAERNRLYAQFQRQAMLDLPQIPLVDVAQVTITNKRLRDHTVTSDGIKANFAHAYLLPQ